MINLLPVDKCHCISTESKLVWNMLELLTEVAATNRIIAEKIEYMAKKVDELPLDIGKLIQPDPSELQKIAQFVIDEKLKENEEKLDKRNVNPNLRKHYPCKKCGKEHETLAALMTHSKKCKEERMVSNGIRTKI